MFVSWIKVGFQYGIILLIAIAVFVIIASLLTWIITAISDLVERIRK